MRKGLFAACRDGSSASWDPCSWFRDKGMWFRLEHVWWCRKRLCTWQWERKDFQPWVRYSLHCNNSAGHLAGTLSPHRAFLIGERGVHVF